MFPLTIWVSESIAQLCMNNVIQEVKDTHQIKEQMWSKEIFKETDKITSAEKEKNRI